VEQRHLEAGDAPPHLLRYLLEAGVQVYRGTGTKEARNAVEVQRGVVQGRGMNILWAVLTFIVLVMIVGGLYTWFFLGYLGEECDVPDSDDEDGW
jgi:hypothetical protein